MRFFCGGRDGINGVSGMKTFHCIGPGCFMGSGVAFGNGYQRLQPDSLKVEVHLYLEVTVPKLLQDDGGDDN